jgi:hypothetical protein
MAALETIGKDTSALHVDDIDRYLVFSPMSEFVRKKGAIGGNAMDSYRNKRALLGRVDQQPYSSASRVLNV